MILVSDIPACGKSALVGSKCWDNFFLNLRCSFIMVPYKAPVKEVQLVTSL